MAHTQSRWQRARGAGEPSPSVSVTTVPGAVCTPWLAQRSRNKFLKTAASARPPAARAPRPGAGGRASVRACDRCARGAVEPPREGRRACPAGASLE